MPIHAMHRWEIDIHIDGKIIDISDRDSDSDITQKPSSAFSFLDKIVFVCIRLIMLASFAYAGALPFVPRTFSLVPFLDPLLFVVMTLLVVCVPQRNYKRKHTGNQFLALAQIHNYSYFLSAMEQKRR